MQAVVLLVGDEILEGHTRDANLQWLAQRLEGMGHQVVRAEVLRDREADLVPALDRAMDQGDVVILTGGLGPTHDDRTREAVAKSLDLDLSVDEGFVDELRERYRRHLGDGDPPEEHVVEAARRMATVPEGEQVLVNEVGSALGFAAEAEEAVVVVLPGVPREMRTMFDGGVAGDVIPDEGAREHVEELVVDMPEAEFSDVLSSLQEANPDVGVGSYPHTDAPRVTVRVRGEAGDVEACLVDLRERLDPELVLEEG